jgi:hypothetical protein
MVDCWASILNDCCLTVSKEHLISASLFAKSNTVFVQGFHWCKDEQMEVGLSSLTSKILCKHHNNSLSNTDSAAGYAFNNFETIAKRISEDAKSNKRFKNEYSSINALLLERWLLKTLINVCYKGKHLIGDGKLAGIPDEKLVKICFGRSKFSGHAGMYVTAGVGDVVGFGSHLTITPIIEESDNRVVAGMFKFAGLFLFLWLMPDKLPEDFNWIKNANFEWKNTQPSKPFRKIKFNTPGGYSHILKFNW